ncbi:hypothetical protein GO013_11440 [Pseudodesulfovibrio sp. JC047]|uniref:hypothetical protein n=1 Tax=Pseudodesulfovibrio sp. JC047 TaxID=2683199 RepID=UPI0013D207E7|nr:hypothetical protein [Pseudodesulfovibrio sp. JC047]NDV20035.1 hypothetical protein [Pseudodesulfovibrio sp. JC047]
MLDSNTLYLLLAMAGFILIAALVVHHHNCSDQIRRKRMEVKGVSQQLGYKIDTLEQELTELKSQIDDLDEQIGALKV